MFVEASELFILFAFISLGNSLHMLLQINSKDWDKTSAIAFISRGNKAVGEAVASVPAIILFGAGVWAFGRVAGFF